MLIEVSMLAWLAWGLGPDHAVFLPMMMMMFFINLWDYTLGMA